MIRDRVISGVCVALLLIAAVLWLPAQWSAGALSLVLLLAAWEWAGFVAQRRGPMRMLFVAACIGLCAVWWTVSGDTAGLHAVLWASLAFWSLAALVIFMSPSLVGRTLVACGGLLALSFAWLALVRMRIDWPQGGHPVMYALLIVWVADSGAYFAGRAWGKRKLAPLVSPGKTWAGLWGGVAACALLALVCALTWQLPLVPLLIVTMAVGLFSVVGDLTESLCKRFAGVKDSGSLIPGHGGVLDRFDSLLAAAPLLMLGLELVPGLHG
jgi:phosphatidate cytidylyltransferase